MVSFTVSRTPSNLETSSCVEKSARNKTPQVEAMDSQTVTVNERSRSRLHAHRCIWVAAAVGLLMLVGGLVAVLGPLIFSHIIIPMLEWEQKNLSPPVLGVAAVASMGLFPVVLLPTGPSMWLIGIVFGYAWGFILIMVGSFIGQSLPYFIGHWLFHARVQAWLAEHPRNAAVLRLAEAGGWWHQYRVTLLLRFSPFPFLLFNYAVTATRIQYAPYISASMTAMIPEAFFTIYCGRLICDLAEAHKRHITAVELVYELIGLRHITAVELVYELIGLAAAGVVLLLLMVHGKRALQQLEEEERAKHKGLEMEQVVCIGANGPGAVETGAAGAFVGVEMPAAEVALIADDSQSAFGKEGVVQQGRQAHCQSIQVDFPLAVKSAQGALQANMNPSLVIHDSEAHEEGGTEGDGLLGAQSFYRRGFYRLGRFIAAVEGSLRQWLSEGSAALVQSGAARPVEGMPLMVYVEAEHAQGHKNYRLTYYFQVSLASSNSVHPAVAAETAAALKRIASISATGRPSPWEKAVHPLQLWFGIQEFVVLAPVTASGVVLDSPEASMLLSTLAIASCNTECSLPSFVPVHDPSRKAFIGFQHGPRATRTGAGSGSGRGMRSGPGAGGGTVGGVGAGGVGDYLFHYEADRITSNVPQNLLSLDGLYYLFAFKLIAELPSTVASVSPDVTVAMRIRYRLRYWGSSDAPPPPKLRPAEAGAGAGSEEGAGGAGAEEEDEFWGQERAWDEGMAWSVWHSVDDPVKGFELVATWKELRASSSSGMAQMEQLDATTADEWLLRALLAPTRTDFDSDDPPQGFAGRLHALLGAYVVSTTGQYMEDFIAAQNFARRNNMTIPPPSVMERVVKDLFHSKEALASVAKYMGKASEQQEASLLPDADRATITTASSVISSISATDTSATGSGVKGPGGEGAAGAGAEGGGAEGAGGEGVEENGLSGKFKGATHIGKAAPVDSLFSRLALHPWLEFTRTSCGGTGTGEEAACAYDATVIKRDGPDAMNSTTIRGSAVAGVHITRELRRNWEQEPCRVPSLCFLIPDPLPPCTLPSGPLSAVAALWLEFIRELRWNWEQALSIPTSHPLPFASCLAFPFAISLLLAFCSPLARPLPSSPSRGGAVARVHERAEVELGAGTAHPSGHCGRASQHRHLPHSPEAAAGRCFQGAFYPLYTVSQKLQLVGSPLLVLLQLKMLLIPHSPFLPTSSSTASPFVLPSPPQLQECIKRRRKQQEREMEERMRHAERMHQIAAAKLVGERVEELVRGTALDDGPARADSPPGRGGRRRGSGRERGGRGSDRRGGRDEEEWEGMERSGSEGGGWHDGRAGRGRGGRGWDDGDGASPYHDDKTASGDSDTHGSHDVAFYDEGGVADGDSPSHRSEEDLDE
ncbi:unnamed protein product [Closterium sp. NIES-53]